MKERIKAVEEYLKYFPNDTFAKSNLLLCEYADELDIDIGKGYYPRIEGRYCVINRQIKVGHTYGLTNSYTKYEHNGKEKIVIWHESSGRLSFVDTEYWWNISDEWQEFMDVLKSYKPLDYDEMNNKYVYDLENGKKLINDYDEIVRNFKEKANKKIKKVEFEKKKRQLELLKEELGES